jgi:hypothetical protein
MCLSDTPPSHSPTPKTMPTGHLQPGSSLQGGDTGKQAALSSHGDAVSLPANPMLSGIVASPSPRPTASAIHSGGAANQEDIVITPSVLSFEAEINALSQDGLLPVINKIWDDELNADHPHLRSDTPQIMLETRNRFRSHALSTFCTMPETITRLLATGNLAAAYHDLNADQDLRSHLDRNLLRSLKQPCIYVRIFADKKGDSPTYKEIFDLAQFIVLYTTNDSSVSLQKELTAFDCQFDEDFVKTRPTSTSRLFTGRHMEKLLAWARVLEMRSSDHVVLQPDVPMPHPLTYAGYAKNAILRQESHRHLSSTSIFNKFLSGYSDTYWDAKEYSFHNFVVCPLGDAVQASPAEMAIASITRSPYRHGGLCNAHAGIQISGIPEPDDPDWETHKQWILSNAPFEANMKNESMRVLSYHRRTDEGEVAKMKRWALIEELDQEHDRVGNIVEERSDEILALVTRYKHLIDDGCNMQNPVVAELRVRIKFLREGIEDARRLWETEA